MSEGDTWSELQAHKKRQDSLRERFQRRKKERQGILSAAHEDGQKADDTKPTATSSKIPTTVTESVAETKPEIIPALKKSNPLLEKWILEYLSDKNLSMPVDSLQLTVSWSKASDLIDSISHDDVTDLVEKLAVQNFIKTKPGLSKDNKPCVLVTEVDYSKLEAIVKELKASSASTATAKSVSKKRKRDKSREGSKSRDASPVSKNKKKAHNDDIQSMLSTMTTIETETKKVGEDILDLLNIKSAKEQLIVEKFKSQGGATVQEFCEHGTREECRKNRSSGDICKKVHFRKIIQKHTDESLGDCSFLNTCFHMDTCKYVHYEVDYTGVTKDKDKKFDDKDKSETTMSDSPGHTLIPPQWIQCDLRYIDFSVIGKFSVVMADPPWDIHMELPYGTMSDDEMRKLAVPKLQDDGYIFLWVTGRAMELGRECLKLWGYERCDELIWVKTNQLQRLIRTGRTGHWLNHGKEHCLVGVKGKPKNINKGLDCDVLVAEVRSTSHKPDEIYGLIERLAPGARKIDVLHLQYGRSMFFTICPEIQNPVFIVELFGRQHNVQPNCFQSVNPDLRQLLVALTKIWVNGPNWLTLGNQLDGVKLMEPDVVERFKIKYPNGIQQLTASK